MLQLILAILLVVYLVDFFKLLYNESLDETTTAAIATSSSSHTTTGGHTSDIHGVEAQQISPNASNPSDGSGASSAYNASTSSSGTAPVDAAIAAAAVVSSGLTAPSSGLTSHEGLSMPSSNMQSTTTSWASSSVASIQSSTHSSNPSSDRQPASDHSTASDGNADAGMFRHPMNRNMDDLFVPGGTGPLSADSIKEYYSKLAKAYLAPFKNGIYRQLYFDILRRRTYSLTPPGANKGVQSMLFQIIDGKVYLMDPYEVPRNSKPFYRTRINEVIWLLSKLAGEGRIKNTEFLISIHDCVQTVNKPHTYRGAHFQESNPTFTIVSCNFSDNIPFPMWEGSKHRDGGFSGWDAMMQEYGRDAVSWGLKEPRAVFRGGIRPSMFFQNKSMADQHCNDVGRTRLRHLAEQKPDLFDVSVGGTCGGVHSDLKRLDPKAHHKYKYILYAEGNCMWADRIRQQLYGPSAILKQETPCGQFFEPLLKPYTHYIPTNFFFTDTVDQIQWARGHDEEAQKVVHNANEFSKNFLSLQGIESYVEVLMREYTSLLVEPNIRLENGAIEVTNKQV